MPRHARTVYECGSEQAYQAHIRRGEPTDEACKAAHTASDRRPEMREARYARQRARRAAIDALIERHQGEFASLLAAEIRRQRLA